MSQVPVPRSAQQIISDMMDTFLSKQGISGIRIGSGVLSIFEAAGQSDFRGSSDLFQLLNATDLNNATGIALDNIGNSENVPRFADTPAIGTVTVSDTSFTKISTTLAQNQAAPIVGTTTLNITDGSSFPTSGNIYIGRGTADYEGPIPYNAATNIGINWTLTLTVGTTKFHNTSETVILAQGGNRQVGAGTTLNIPLANISTTTSYSTLYTYILADGENVLPNVSIVAAAPGTIGNCIAGSISQFSSPPFNGAAVTNPTPITTGIDTELDDDYRERIINVRASRALGTVLAIETNAIGVTDGISRVTSASFIRNFGRASTLYIDDGSGYEMTTAPIAIESLVDAAVGGENHFETTQRPIAQAFAITINTAPFSLKPTDALSVNVGGINYIHSFNDGIFSSISNASAYEVVASINSDPNIAFMARTANAGANVVIFSKTDDNDDIQVVLTDTSTGATDANEALGFTSGVNSTLELFKNDRLLFKDGRTAFITSNPFANWTSVSSPQTLTLAIDGTPATQYTFVDQDFINANTGYVTLNINSLIAWQAVFNAKIPGITASINNGRLVLTSNLGASSRAQVNILTGSLISAGFFNVGDSIGINNDYTLDRNNGEIFLNDALELNDKLSIGTTYTRAFIESALVGTTTLASNAVLWFAVDNNANIISNGVATNIPIGIAVSAIRPWGHILTLTASAGTPFNNVIAGDWMILWDPALNVSLLGVFKVVTVTGSIVSIERRDMTAVRVGHRSVALATSGATICNVLTCGGSGVPELTIEQPPLFVTNSVEIFNPNTSITTAVKGMNVARAYHTATLLNNGKVLVVGGHTGVTVTSTLEIYDPNLDNWTLSGSTLPAGIWNHQATLLGNGNVLITGGCDAVDGTGTINTFSVYNPTSDTLTSGSLVQSRQKHKQVLLPSGDVLIVGGIATPTPTATAEIWNHNTQVSTATGSMNRARYGFGLALFGTSPTTIYAVGNNFGLAGNNSYEIYTIGSGTWGTETTIPNNMVFENKDIVTIPNGSIIGLYGYNSVTPTTNIGFSIDGGPTFTNISGDSLWTDSSAKWDTQTVAIADGINGVKNKVMVIGGVYQQSTTFGFAPTASLEIWDYVSKLWIVPDPAISASLDLGADGIAFARLNGYIQQITVPAATNYTATSFASTLNGLLSGATAITYLTNQLRINTNSYGSEGSIALLAQNAAASGLQLEDTSSIVNLVNHVGSVESNSDLGTPIFRDTRVLGAIENNGLSISNNAITSNLGLIGLKNWMSGIDNTTTFHPTAYTNPRSGNNDYFASFLTSTTNFPTTSDVFTRLTPIVPFNPTDRVYFANPYAIAYNDVLNLIVDNDITKQFAINMFRVLSTINNNYGTTNTFKDSTAGGVSLATTFGLNYNFNDFTAYMPARTVAFSGDSTRSMIFRYYRPGADGNNVQVRFGNPIGPNQALGFNIVQTNSTLVPDITLTLASGALRTPTTHNTMKLGQAIISASGVAHVMMIFNLAVASASRTSDVTTLTLTLPGGTSITDHGLQVGNLVWLNSTDSNFSSGLKTITVRTANTISYAEIAANATGTNTGDISFDSLGEDTLTGSGTVIGDWFRFTDPLNSILGNMTFNIIAVDSNGRSVNITTGDQINPTALSSLLPSTTILWYPISVSTNVQTFANPGQNSAAIVAAINALPNTPVTATELGDGTGTITQSTADTLNSYINGWYTLSDGVNYVQVTTSPGSPSGDYSLTFKNPINASLSTNADWQHELIYLVPTTAQNVVNWLNTPTVTGLSTVCSINTANNGHAVQLATLTPGSAGGIQVQGGMANGVTATVVGTAVNLTNNFTSYTTVSNSDAIGFTAGMWCEIDNTTTAPLFPFTIGFGITSWTSDGLIQFNGPIAFRTVAKVQAKLQFEKQGAFVAISDMGMNGSMNIDDVLPNYWVRITAPVSPSLPAVSPGNIGIFKVLRVDSGVSGSNGTLWIENLNISEEQSEAFIEVFTELSVMPGQSFIVLDPVFGAGNMGVWTITNVGTTTATSNDPFTNLTSFVVDVSQKTPQAQGASSTLTSSNVNLIYIQESTPSKFIRKILNISPNNSNGAFTDIKWDEATPSAPGAVISSVYGSIIRALDKLNFPLTFFNGADGYSYATGLVGAVNTVLYGDPEDPITYPGVASADAKVNVSSSVIKRTQVAVAVRIKTGVVLKDIGNRIKSAIATVINQNPVGQSIAFSQIVTAVQAVVGVTSDVIVSPIYNVSNDLIPVQPQEKTKVLNLNDVQVSFLGI